MNGRLIWFNPDKRHGYIRTEDGERLLVKEDGFMPGHMCGDRMAGTPLTFERADTADGAEAVGVCIVSHSEPRRARIRHR
jgi:cold shock CspA family protein